MYWRQVVAQAGAVRKPTDRPEPTRPMDFRGGFSGNERDVFFYNTSGRPGFFEIGYSLGLDFSDDGRAFIPLDVDGDGDLDLATASLQRLRLMENTLPHKDRHFARLRLRATRTQSHALGARVVLESGGVRQQDYVKATAGFQTQVPLDLHFGLRTAPGGVIDRVTVRWPSGHVETFEGLPIDRLILLAEGEAPRAAPLASWPESRPRVAGTFDPRVRARTIEGEEVALARKGRPVVVNFWAPWCGPCRKELPVLRSLAATFGDHVDFVGVSVETTDRASVHSAIEKHRLDYAQRFANDAVMESFFGGDGEAPLPSTFVLDERGELRRAFYRAVDREDLVELLESLHDRWVSPSHLATLGFRAFERGQLDEARRLLERGLKANPKDVALLVNLGAVARVQGRHEEATSLLRRATDVDPTHPSAWGELALAYEALGDPEKASECAKRSLELRPDPAVQSMLARLAAGSGAATRPSEPAPPSAKAARHR